MKRISVFLYGTFAYVFFLGVFLYAIGFVGNLVVPKSIDSAGAGGAGPLGTAILINALVLGIFAVQHTVMARPSFKAKIVRMMPKPMERSTFVLVANLVFVLIFWQWRPMTGIVWEVEHEIGRLVLFGLFWLGWGIVLVSTFLIDHFGLFGMRQSMNYLQGKEASPPRFQVHSLYKMVRHPLMLGFLIAFWATPVMTTGHLLFSCLTTGYILVGIWFEERDLVRVHGADYLRYQGTVPKLVPFMPSGKSTDRSTPEVGEEPAAS